MKTLERGGYVAVKYPGCCETHVPVNRRKADKRYGDGVISYIGRMRRKVGRMTGFLLRRLVKYIVLLLFASFLTFSLASVFFHPLDSLLQRNPRPPQTVIDAKAAELDLDKPIPVRYAKWVSGAVRGDFGTTVGGQPVSDSCGGALESACGWWCWAR